MQLLCQLKLTLENEVLSKEKKRGVVCLEIAVCWLLRDCSFNVTCECAYLLRKIKKEKKGVVKKNKNKREMKKMGTEYTRHSEVVTRC